jgi:hypothetical protein
MSFDRKLKQLVDIALDLERDLDGSINRMARALADAIISGRAADGSRLGDEFEAAKEACLTYDAGLFVQEKVIDGHNALICDVKARRDYRALQDDIDRIFEEGLAPRRGFSYVAWSMSPETYYYVGKAGSPDRLNLAGHGKLAHALTEATWLSLVFPSQSREDTLLGLEGSIIELITHATGEPPKLNDQACGVPEAGGQERLNSVAEFLEATAKALRIC